ncbi:hypothetical protein CIG75_03755 [Tumebacillus algifaecis]|uniref:Integral membrane protein n=1 Tax=Tumebacillus algifaecis TaxID=1214604 RepID=A0A223CYG3_9BACL|nr:hypothetical protein [Tumebacillus algifaecis]ASS74186.1 hypothetical protein CIG75_03755 [Tumebacillus algifaecis]
MEINVQIPAIISSVSFFVVAAFQILLALGFPLGAFSWGGTHPGVLPPRLRFASLAAAGILLFMAYVMLSHTNVLASDLRFFPSQALIWVLTIFMGINTLGNLASKNKKEKLVMTPLTSIAFISCLLVAISNI